MSGPVVTRLPHDSEKISCDGGITLWLHANGIMHVKLPEKATVAGRHAAAAAVAVHTLTAGKSFPLLLDLTNVKSVSRHAREMYGQPRTVTAYALLGSGPVDRVLAHYFLGGAPVLVPTKFFEVEAEAVQWLESFLDDS